MPVASVVRYPRPRLVRVHLGSDRGWYLAYSYSQAPFSGPSVIFAYAVWSLRGPRRVWAF